MSEHAGPPPERAEAAAIDEVEALRDLSRHLAAGRPTPGGAFRAELKATLLAGSRPRADWPLIGAYAGSAVVLFAAVGLGIADIGPLAP